MGQSPEHKPPIPPGELLAGKYALVSLLGKGGMGEVWEAQHHKLGHRVAIKFIDAEASKDRDAVKRFQNEARAPARLQSRYIVQVLDDGLTPDDRPFIVMERLLGVSLAERLRRAGKFEPRGVAKVVREVCRGLEKAHEAGIIHRDLKPDNIFLHCGPDDTEETTKIVDFGIAKFLEGAFATATTTRTGSLLGTPSYMSPEQTRGVKEIDLRTDLWSLAIIVYQCLTGALPFRGNSMGDLFIHICLSEHAPPSSLRPDLPTSLDGWMARALAKQPRHRFASAREFAETFERALTGEEQVPMPASADVISMFSGRPTMGEGIARTMTVNDGVSPSNAATFGRTPINESAGAPTPFAASSSKTDPPDSRNASTPERATMGAFSTPREEAAPPSLRAASRGGLLLAAALVVLAALAGVVLLTRRDNPTSVASEAPPLASSTATATATTTATVAATDPPAPSTQASSSTTTVKGGLPVRLAPGVRSAAPSAAPPATTAPTAPAAAAKKDDEIGY